MAGLAKRALLASRANTYLSVPLLFCMGGASHFPSINPVTILAVFAVGFATVWTCINVSGKVGKTV